MKFFSKNGVEQLPVQYFKKMKNIEKNLVKFLDKHDKLNESFIIFYQYLQDQKLLENKQKFKSFLYLLVSLSNYYQHLPNFFTKYKLIFQSLGEKIKIQQINNCEPIELLFIYSKLSRNYESNL